MENEKSSNKLVMYNALSTIILYAITFFSAPLFSRMLGTDEYGVVQVYNTWASFFAVILGVYTRGTLAIAKIHYRGEEFVKYQSSVLFLSLLSFLSGLIIVIIGKSMFVSFLGLDVRYLILIMFHSFGTYCVYFVNAKFTYEMKAKNNLVVSVTLSVLTFALSYLLIKLMNAEHLYTGRIIGMSSPYILAGIIIIVYIFKQGKTYFNKEYWKFCIPLCLPLIFHGISGIICASSDRVMIQKMIGLVAVGIYALAYNFANIMESIWNALNNSWNPFFFEYVKHNKYVELKKRSKKYIRLYTSLSMGFILMTPEVFHAFAAPEYWEGAKIIPVIVLSQYSIFIYSFAANYEFAFKRTDMVALGSAVAGVANVVLNLIFINCLGYLGAAIATLISNIILAIIHIIFAKKLVKDKWIYEVKMFVIPLFGLLVSVIFYYCCYSIWIIRWGLAVMIGLYMLRGVYRDRAIF